MKFLFKWFWNIEGRIVKIKSWNECLYEKHGQRYHIWFLLRPLKDCEVMQFTGLTDKNEKGDYEGDKNL